MIFRNQLLWLIIFIFVLNAKAQSRKDSIVVAFNFKWKNESLVLNKTYQSEKDSLLVSVLKFYVSGIEIRFDDNSKLIENNSYHLIDIENKNTLKIALLKNNNKAINRISFNIGIDSLASVSGAMSGALDATNGMYWAWQSGFINMKIEGKSSSCATRNNTFQFHIGGYLKPNYALRKINIDCNKNFSNDINLMVDLSKLFNEIDLKSTNSIMTPSQKAMKIADLSTKMFSLE